MNLLTNAVKFTPNMGEIKVKMKLTRVSLSSNQIYLSVQVKDSGIGMNAEEVAHAFEPTYKVADTRKQRLNPLGNRLGLSICKQIC